MRQKQIDITYHEERGLTIIRAKRYAKIINSPIFPCLRVLRFVAVPGGSLNHFQEPTRSYLYGSVKELGIAKSTVTLTWVSTLDFVPFSGMLGNISGKLQDLEHRQWI